MTAVTFDYAAWSVRFPALVAQTSEDNATAIFTDAQYSWLGNDLDGQPASVVREPNLRLIMFNLLVAHFVVLNTRAAAGGGAGAGMVGNVSSAAEGSVSIGMSAYAGATQSSAFWVQTEYGAQFWQAAQPFMRARYIPGPRPYTGVLAGGRYGGFGWGR